MMIFFVMKNGVMASSHKHILFFIWAAIKRERRKYDFTRVFRNTSEW